ncbi:MAG TPA: BCAM0308 family protein [Patescibacteria group bacterium]|nr:BCAM0308 family protein [Patescibacteria group bacterium]
MPTLKQPPRHHKDSKQAKKPDQQICRICGLIFLHARWMRDGKIERAWRKDKETTYILCPACREIKQGTVAGTLVIDREFYQKNPTEIDREIRNVEKIENQRDPLKRILGIVKSRREVVVHASRKELAVTIGKHLNRSRGGKLELRFSSHEDFVQVFLRATPTKKNNG